MVRVSAGPARGFSSIDVAGRKLRLGVPGVARCYPRKMVNIVNVGYDSTNYYIIESERGRLLVDVGYPGTLPKLRHAMRRAGVELASVGHLLVTHYHPDHAGLAEELKSLRTKLIVVDLQQRFIPLLKGYFKPHHHYIDIAANDNQVTSIVQSRSVLQKLGFAGEILATPGHTDDSVSLVLDIGVAFIGDLGQPGEDGAAGKSWAAIRASGARTIYPGHGPMYQLPE